MKTWFATVDIAGLDYFLLLLLLISPSSHRNEEGQVGGKSQEGKTNPGHGLGACSLAPCLSVPKKSLSKDAQTHK